MKVIFLDVDGVLNGENSTSFCRGFPGVDDCKAKRLKKIVEETGAQIVLSSSWKIGWHRDLLFKPEQDEFANYLDEKLLKQNLQILDKTEDQGENRGEGILRWMQGLTIESFVILDDESFDYAYWGLLDNFVHTDPKVGLTDENVMRAIAILQANGNV